ncbi:TfoX/Sxy family protein [Eubacterium callanderi]|uniref:TfoX/Sxy family protein n=1 Tax=Eubacterium callanderi TaxID=53442 RepID=UPI00391A8921
MSQMEKLPNIGKVVARELEAVGIDTPEKLRAAGTKKAFLKLKQNDRSSCLHKLMGLEGAIQGVRKYDLPDEVKQELKDWFNSI